MTEGNVFRGEHWELSYGIETGYGIDPKEANLTRPFGVFEKASLGDPEMDYTPFYGSGGGTARRYFRAYRNKMALEASISDVLLLNGAPLFLPFGSIVNTNLGGAPIVWRHDIKEITLLPSFTMHASFWKADNDATPNFQRRYLGCKVGKATISAEEEERLRVSFDSVLFKDIKHNAPDGVAPTSVPKYASLVKPVLDYPTTEPFFFSGGVLTINNNVFARVKSFKLDVNNNCEAKYYIAGHDPANPIPYTVLEGKREYTLTCNVDAEDTKLYQEVLQAGLSGTSVVGIGVSFKISRGNVTQAPNDYIQIDMPGAGYGPTAEQQGCFLKKAPMPIDSGSPAVAQELEFVVRRVDITAEDGDSWA